MKGLRELSIAESLSLDQYPDGYEPIVDSSTLRPNHRQWYRFQGRDFRLTDVPGEVVWNILA